MKELKTKYDDVKTEIETEGQKFQNDDLKEIRWTVSKLQSDIAYYQYQIYIRQKYIKTLDDKYCETLGVAKNDKPIQ